MYGSSLTPESTDGCCEQDCWWREEFHFSPLIGKPHCTDLQQATLTPVNQSNIGTTSMSKQSFHYAPSGTCHRDRCWRHQHSFGNWRRGMALHTTRSQSTTKLIDVQVARLKFHISQVQSWSNTTTSNHRTDQMANAAKMLSECRNLLDRLYYYLKPVGVARES